MKKTFQLRNLIETYKATLPNDQFERVSSEIDQLILHYIQHLRPITPGSQRAKESAALIDLENDRASHIKTSCQKGCASCCNLEIEITAEDAELLAQAVIENNIPFDKERLIEQASRKRLDPLWERRVHSENRCVLLNAENACSVYESRPMVCRKHAVVSPADDCMRPGGEPLPRTIPINEIIISANLNITSGDHGSFASMLLSELNKQQVKLETVEAQVEEPDSTSDANL